MQTRLSSLLLAFLIGCACAKSKAVAPPGPEPASAGPGTSSSGTGLEPGSAPPASGNAPPTSPAEPGATPPAGNGAPPGPSFGEKCGPADTCAPGLACASYYGIAGARGPEFKTCEKKCATDNDCPAGRKCGVIADGPGQVCR
jgi:hypothetical protein